MPAVDPLRPYAMLESGHLRVAVSQVPSNDSDGGSAHISPRQRQRCTTNLLSAVRRPLAQRRGLNLGIASLAITVKIMTNQEAAADVVIDVSAHSIASSSTHT